MAFGRADLAQDALASIKVELKHIEQAMNEIEITATRQVTTEVPDVNWDEVGGLEEVKQVYWYSAQATGLDVRDSRFHCQGF